MNPERSRRRGIDALVRTILVLIVGTSASALPLTTQPREARKRWELRLFCYAKKGGGGEQFTWVKKVRIFEFFNPLLTGPRFWAKSNSHTIFRQRIKFFEMFVTFRCHCTAFSYSRRRTRNGGGGVPSIPAFPGTATSASGTRELVFFFSPPQVPQSIYLRTSSGACIRLLSFTIKRNCRLLSLGKSSQRFESRHGHGVRLNESRCADHCKKNKPSWMCDVRRQSGSRSSRGCGDEEEEEWGKQRWSHEVFQRCFRYLVFHLSLLLF